MFTKAYKAISGQEYTIQFYVDLTPDSWRTLGTQAGDSSGLISIIDNPPAGISEALLSHAAAVMRSSTAGPSVLR
jgi:hypothetical protein